MSEKKEGAILVINIDCLHSINELYGREIGDEVIIKLTNRLQRIFKCENTVLDGEVPTGGKVSVDQLATAEYLEKGKLSGDVTVTKSGEIITYSFAGVETEDWTLPDA